MYLTNMHETIIILSIAIEMQIHVFMARYWDTNLLVIKSHKRHKRYKRSTYQINIRNLQIYL